MGLYIKLIRVLKVLKINHEISWFSRSAVESRNYIFFTLPHVIWYIAKVKTMILVLSFYPFIVTTPSTGYKFAEMVTEYFILSYSWGTVVWCAPSWKFGVFSWKGTRLLLTTDRFRAEIVLRRKVFIKTFKFGTCVQQISYQVLISFSKIICWSL